MILQNKFVWILQSKPKKSPTSILNKYPKAQPKRILKKKKKKKTNQNPIRIHVRLNHQMVKLKSKIRNPKEKNPHQGQPLTPPPETSSSST